MPRLFEAAAKRGVPHRRIAPGLAKDSRGMEIVEVLVLPRWLPRDRYFNHDERIYDTIGRIRS